jgi:hypothetical protein
MVSPQADIRRRAQRAVSRRAGEQFQYLQKRKRNFVSDTPKSTNCGALCCESREKAILQKY